MAIRSSGCPTRGRAWSRPTSSPGGWRSATRWPERHRGGGGDQQVAGRAAQPVRGDGPRAAGRRGRHGGGRARRSSPSTTVRMLRAEAPRRDDLVPDPAGNRGGCGDRRVGRVGCQAVGCRSWSATGRRPPRPSGGRGSRPPHPTRAGSRPTTRPPRRSPPTRRCRVGSTTGSRCTPRPGRRRVGRCPTRPRRPAEPATAYAGPGVLAKPPVRKLAKDLGVDLRQLTGSGTGWRDHPRRCDLAPRAGRSARGAVPATGSGPSRRRRARDDGSRSRASARPRPRRWWPRRSPLRTSASG